MSDEDTMPYQFPELSWNRGSTVCSDVGHGLLLREKGSWIIPSFQRPLVWTEEQKIKFMESLILGLPIGEYTIHRNKDYTHDVLDGQQRWSAIFDYVDDKFPVFGLQYRDLNIVTRRCFQMIPFSHRVCMNLSEDEKLDVYERLAYGGTPHVKSSS